MKTLHIAKLNFLSPLHLSRGEEDDYEKSLVELHADTIKSALFVMYKQHFDGDVEGDAFFKAIELSSAFPFYQVDQQNVEYFFPKLLGRKININKTNESNEEGSKYSKKIKKIQYVCKEAFEELISGNDIDAFIDEKNEGQPFKISKNGKLIIKSGLDEQNKIEFFESDLQQRVSVSRDYSQDANPFVLERLWFYKQAGLFFIYNIVDENILTKELFQKLVELLGTFGIGTDKNVGNGQFEAKLSTIEFKEPQLSSGFYNLGIFNPDLSKVKDINTFIENASYNLIKRGGYIASPQNGTASSKKKKSVIMFGVGSYFESNEKPIGRVLDLQSTQFNEHPIYRDGLGFWIKCNQIQEDIEKK